MKQHKLFSMAIVMIVLTMAIGGCNKSDDPVSASKSNPSTNLSIGFSKVSSKTLFGKITAVDSLHIDSIIVVLQRIKFESHIDSVKVDTTGKESSDDSNESNITFKGPFIIHVRDSNAVDFANQTLPAGTYDGIKFKIHRIKKGEKYEDSDEHNRKSAPNNDSIVGYSVAVWGTVKKNGAWVQFAFKSNIELEFKLKGNFTIAASTNTLNLALRFNSGDWFTNVKTGLPLDPTDQSKANQELINEAIKKSFGKGRGGHDSNHDGHPED
jgi:hypothetical protein